MTLSRFLLALLIVLTALPISAERLGLLDDGKIYYMYGRQVKSSDFTDYHGVICYYSKDGLKDMTLHIEPEGMPADSITLHIVPDGWRADSVDSQPAYVYKAADGSCKVVVTAIDDADAILSVSRPHHPDITLLFDRQPLDL